MRGARLILLLAALAGGDAAAATMPRGAVVLPGAKLATLLHQCSRASPQKGEATWQPTAEDIVALEALLPAALSPRFRPGDAKWSKAPTGWGRQYVGIVRGGRRFIYGNFVPQTHSNPVSPGGEPVMVCDGGPDFFGVEYDVAARRIIHVDFNGIA